MEPAPPRGSTEEQLRRQWSYLYQMHQPLHRALEQPTESGAIGREGRRIRIRSRELLEQTCGQE